MLAKIYIVSRGERYYLRDWYIVEDNDCIVFTAEPKHAMRFKDWRSVKDYKYQLTALGYSPIAEVLHR